MIKKAAHLGGFSFIIDTHKICVVRDKPHIWGR